MALPATHNLEMYRGDDFEVTFGLVEVGGRVVDDLVLTSGSTSATSATAGFVSADVGKKIVTHNEAGITDTCTISSVSSATTVTLSQSATSSGDFAASIRALDCSAYSAPAADIRATADGSEVETFTFDSARSDVGVFVMSMTDTETAALSAGVYVWDWQITDADSKVRTLLRGSCTIVADVTR
jgi:hypothetical protein